jgi:hypothetical protein
MHDISVVDTARRHGSPVEPESAAQRLLDAIDATDAPPPTSTSWPNRTPGSSATLKTHLST